MRNITLSFDGSCGPTNPKGTATYSFIIMEDGQEEIAAGGKIGTGVGNNYAEFFGLYKGLEYITKLVKMNKLEKFQIFVRGDSVLAINIMKKKRKAHSESLYYPAAEFAVTEARTLRELGAVLFFDWVPRLANQEADALSKYQKYI